MGEILVRKLGHVRVLVVASVRKERCATATYCCVHGLGKRHIQIVDWRNIWWDGCTMNIDTDILTNPVARYVACFDSAYAAAAAAGISTEMLRRMRKRGYVTTRKRALVMAQACGFRVGATQLMALPPPGGSMVQTSGD
ncbi:hypothetical protein QLQ15_12275 [Lysobacter sp. LF1]|uniref:Uncharacterized protein n=1 Tax=Lysobacter stagni TaxID=3045172 RepID=A0ABT6XHP3_9GAMM|nr:hypothetical protein [Lysobacter sp. LF1]MDI9239680.1 hypothetical protein [Lysobacter sp. LF1]